MIQATVQMRWGCRHHGDGQMVWKPQGYQCFRWVHSDITPAGAVVCGQIEPHGQKVVLEVVLQ